jgi:Fe-S cluster assembly protein SufD
MQLLSNLELKDRDATLSNLLTLCQAQKIGVIEPELVLLLQELRDRTSSIINLATLPTTRDEEWRFTDLSALRQLNFSENTSPQIDITALILPEATNSRLVFVNGVYNPQLSAVADLPDGVTVSNLAGLPLTHRSGVKKYLAQQQGSSEVFTALNTAGISDVAIVLVDKNVVVDTPIHLLFVSTNEQPIISQPRCLLVAETGSKVTVVEEYKKAGSTDTVYFTNSTRIEQESLEAFHIGKTAVSQARDSRYTCYAVSLGGKLSRHNLEVFQAGEQTDTNLFGLTAISGNQVGDTHSAIALNYPHGTTNQLHKCIVSDRAHGVFNGKVFVPKPAQLTNAAQLNRNLLLSSRARVDTKPQLEITADNVKCSHGATVSQLEDDEIFYLQSRGINASDAKNLLVNAFAAEIINLLPINSLRESLNAAVKSFSTVS